MDQQDQTSTTTDTSGMPADQPASTVSEPAADTGMPSAGDTQPQPEAPTADVTPGADAGTTGAPEPAHEEHTA